MKINKFSKKPLDAIDRTNKDLVISYPVDKKKNNQSFIKRIFVKILRSK